MIDLKVLHRFKFFPSVRLSDCERLQSRVGEAKVDHMYFLCSPVPPSRCVLSVYEHKGAHTKEHTQRSTHTREQSTKAPSASWNVENASSCGLDKPGKLFWLDLLLRSSLFVLCFFLFFVCVLFSWLLEMSWKSKVVFGSFSFTNRTVVDPFIHLVSKCWSVHQLFLYLNK